MRNKAIDMMRALTMVLMVTVNEFWSVEDIPHWMHHAKITEDMMGLSDVVFPLFLFAMGMSIPYAIENKIYDIYKVNDMLIANGCEDSILI